MCKYDEEWWIRCALLLDCCHIYRDSKPIQVKYSIILNIALYSHSLGKGTVDFFSLLDFWKIVKIINLFFISQNQTTKNLHSEDHLNMQLTMEAAIRTASMKNRTDILYCNKKREKLSADRLLVPKWKAFFSARFHITILFCDISCALTTCWDHGDGVMCQGEGAGHIWKAGGICPIPSKRFQSSPGL